MRTIMSLKTLLLLIPVFLLSSCNNDLWDEHYSAGVTEKSELNIYDYIKSRSELSTFRQAIEIAGYDKLLSEDFTYTVWAPDNDALAGFDLTNTELVRRVVLNHITRFTHPTSRVQEQSLLMINGKILDFKRLPDNKFSLQGSVLKQTDIAVRNGMIHLMSSYVPYILNHWEYIAVADGVDSLRNYILSLTRSELDFDASYLDGVLIDSVFMQTNSVLTTLAELNTEDSIYTSLLPDNQAWDERYKKIFPYYKALEADGGELAQSTNARWMMVRDLFFRGRIAQPVTNDSLQSTIGTQFTNATQLIPTSAPVALSNGYSYKVSTFGQKPEETWLKPIRIEAENASFGRRTKDYELTTLSSIGTSYEVSNGFYINARALSTNTTAQMYINFPIPNTLATKYNIYCVFVPMSITDSTNKKAYKVRFSINYNYTETNQNDSVWVGNTGFVKVRTQAKQFTTTPMEMTKVLVASNYQIPWANVIRANRGGGNLIGSEKIRAGLLVENAAGTTALERLNFSRDIRIDCIILEPVE